MNEICQHKKLYFNEDAGNPLVSVIIPFCNPPPQFFIEAIESILAQTYANWELILVDDGSVRKSVLLAERYANAYPSKILLVTRHQEKNLGPSAARQLGVASANGSLLSFLDADDIWLPAKLTDQVEILEKNRDAGMSVGNSLYWSSWRDETEQNGVDYRPEFNILTNKLYAPPELFIHFLEGKGAVPTINSVLVRKSVFSAVGGFDIDFHNIFEDQVFLSKVILFTKVFVSDKIWDKYRQRTASFTGNAASNKQQQSSRQEYLRWIAAYFEAQNITNQKLRIALYRQMWLLPKFVEQSESDQLNNLERIMRKWILRVEEKVLPAKARQLLWLRNLNF